MKLQDLLSVAQDRGDRAERARGGSTKPAVVGGAPLVSLLPKEVLDASSRRASRRALLLAVGGVALITGAVIAASSLAAADAHDDLADATQQLAHGNAQVAKFGDLQREEQEIAIGRAAVKVGGSTSVDWDAQLAGVESVMPAEFTVTAVTALSAIPGTAFDQSADPLDPPYVATMTVTATATRIDTLPAWLRLLRSLPSYASATPVVTSAPGVGATDYTVVITLHLNKRAFAPVKEETTQ